MNFGLSEAALIAIRRFRKSSFWIACAGPGAIIF